VVRAPEAQRDTHNGTTPSPRRGAPRASTVDERAPARQDEPASLRQDDRAPAREDEPESVREDEPASVREDEPASVREDEPAPARQDDRAPACEPCAHEGDEPIYHAPDDQRPRLSFPAKNLPFIIEAIQRWLNNNLKGAVKDGDVPIWSGGLLWADVKTMLSKEAVSLEGLTECEVLADPAQNRRQGVDINHFARPSQDRAPEGRQGEIL
jgi:hypothetical protein